MTETREIIIVMNMSREAVRLWFEKIQSQARHPQYQGGIKILGPLETEK
jgi:hypothetical protein